jgi:hypothetical protein
MYSYEDRIRAVELYIELGNSHRKQCSVTATVLGAIQSARRP